MNLSNRTRLKTLLLVAAPLIVTAALPTIAFAGPYGGLAPGTPQLGPGLASPAIVPGKELSTDNDLRMVAGAPVLSPEQVLAWDGSGGVDNGVDYVGERINFTILSQVDAIANQNDALFTNTIADEAHIIFSIDVNGTNFAAGVGITPVTVPGVGPITLANGNIIGGTREVSYELGTTGVSIGNPVNEQGLWASALQVNDNPNQIFNIDGLEVWGPEPGFTADSNKYSLKTDSGSAALPGGAVAVWNSTAGTSYISHSEIINAVVQVLGPLPTNIPSASINLDALMVHEVAGDDDDFGRDPNNPSVQDLIIFSISQIPDITSASGYYATGSELIVLNGVTGNASFLHHGGHDWDKTWTLANMKTQLLSGQQLVDVQLDISGLEAITEGTVPEPTGMLLALIGLATVSACRKRR